MKFLISSLLMIVSVSAFAGPDCTKEPKTKWQDEKKFQEKLVADGYKIKVFKVTKGNCYEIYGWNKEGKKVEIYFSPVDGSKVKEEIN
nr:PepSY domain-containing protein [Bacteriovorax sp. HI3]